MSKYRQYKTKSAGSLSVKDVDVKSGIVTGYFAAFNNVDSDGDIFQKGAFSNTLNSKKSRVMHLLQHNVFMPLSRPHVLLEDSKGLYFESNVSKTSYGKDTIQLYADGVYNEHSVGFQIIASKEETRDEKQVQIITEAKFWEGSTVTWGANSETTFEGFKYEDLATKMSKLSSVMKGGNYSDNTYHMIEALCEQLKTLISTGSSTALNDEQEKSSQYISAFMGAVKI